MCKHLQERGIEVFEVNRPNRARSRLKGKSDPTDAENAVHSVLSEESTATPKSHDGRVEALRYLVIARKSSVKSKTQTINQIKALLVTAPDEIRQNCYVSSPIKCAEACESLRTGSDSHLEISLNSMLHLLASRWHFLTTELKEIDRQMNLLTASSAPTLIQQFGVGSYMAATLMVAAGDNSERLSKEPSFATLCGANQLEASSGKNNVIALTVEGPETLITPFGRLL